VVGACVLLGVLDEIRAKRMKSADFAGDNATRGVDCLDNALWRSWGDIVPLPTNGGFHWYNFLLDASYGRMVQSVGMALHANGGRNRLRPTFFCHRPDSILVGLEGQPQHLHCGTCLQRP